MKQSYKNKTYFQDEYRVSFKGKYHNLAAMQIEEMDTLLEDLENFLFEKKKLLTKFQLEYEKNKNFHYAENTVYLKQKKHETRINSVDKEITSISVTHSLVQDYKNFCSVPIKLVKGDLVFLVQNIDDLEISEKIKAGYKFHSAHYHKKYLNRKFVQKTDLTKIEGKRELFSKELFKTFKD